MMVVWVKVMAINMKKWAYFESILEKELIGLGNEFTAMVVRERGESWMTQTFDLSSGVDVAPIYNMGWTERKGFR